MSDVVEAEIDYCSSAYPPSIQAGIPKLSETPQGWSRHRLGDLLQRIDRPARLVDSDTYQLVTAKRNRGGIVAREVLRGDQIRTKTQFYVAAGDFLISNRQISHGACGVVPHSLDGALVSNEYTAFHTTDLLDPAFLSALSHSVYFQQTCFHSSIGVHVEKLVFRLEDWMRWEFDVPPLDQQRRIVAVLDTWDRAIDQTQRLIASKNLQLSALIRQVFSSALDLSSALPKTWNHKPLGSLAKVVGGGTPDTADLALWNGGVLWCTPTDIASARTRRLTSTARTISPDGLRSSSATLLPVGSVVLCSRASVGVCAIAAVPMCTNQGFQSLVPKPGTDPDFLYYLAVACERRFIRGAAGSTFLEITGREVSKLVVSAPPLSVQRRVGQQLAAFDDHIDLLNDRLANLQAQKRGLLQKLLSGEWQLDTRFDTTPSQPALLAGASA